jgi:hypothetical protein
MSVIKHCLTLSIAVILSFTLINSAIAYYPVGGVLFLTVSPSTVANGMGQTHSPLNPDDSFQSYFFPGSSSGKPKTIAYSFKKDQLPQFGLSDIHYNAVGFHGGRKINCCGDTSALLTLGIYNINLILGDRAWKDEDGHNLGTINNWFDGVIALRGGWKWNKGWNRRRFSQLTVNGGLGLDFVSSFYATSIMVPVQSPTRWPTLCMDWGVGAVARIYNSE